MTTESEMSLRHGPLAPKWAAVFVGLCFAIPGLLGVIANVPYFGKFAVRTWTEVRNYPATNIAPSWRVVRLSDTQHGFIHDGFEAGGTALFCMAVFVVGTGIAASRFLEQTGRRRLSFLLALPWHVLGITTGAWFVHVAPRPLSYEPLLTVGVFEWLGLIPLALGVSPSGRWRAEIWNGWGGALVGAILGGLAGAVVDVVRFGVLGQHAQHGFAVPGWIIGILSVGVVTGTLFFVYALRWPQRPTARSGVQRICP